MIRSAAAGGAPEEAGMELPVTRREASATETVRANRAWWDRASDGYQAEHGEFLRDDGFIWGPEGLDEADARLLGPVTGRLVLEVGCGAAQCARWLAKQGASVIGIDLSRRQLEHARRIDAASGAPNGVRWSRPTRPLCRSGRAGSTWPAPRTAHCRSWPTRIGCCARWPGCSGRADAGCSRSVIRSAGPSPTTRARPAW